MKVYCNEIDEEKKFLENIYKKPKHCEHRQSFRADPVKSETSDHIM